MQNECSENTLIRQREGTTQEARYIPWLNPENIKLMGFEVEDWMNFAQKFSEHIHFYKDEDHKNPQGNWEPFHDDSGVLKTIKSQIESYTDGEITPQMGLFVCFLKLLNKSKDAFNTITKRHLDFYYKEVLQLNKRAAKEDTVYTIYELAKNATEQLLEKDAKLAAGKDAEGNALRYGLTEELVVNKAKVSSLKNTYLDTNGWYASDVANSDDGSSWLPFGDASRTNAKKGFTIAAPSLKLTEGPRNITIEINFKEFDDKYDTNNLKSFFSVEHTGEKDWVMLNDEVLTFKITTKKLKITIELDETADGIFTYDEGIHQGSYQATTPLLRILFKQDVLNADSNTFYTYLQEQTLKNITIATTSTYSKNLTVQNDSGKINLDKPFYPFGTVTKKNAKLKIGSEEWVGKCITDINVSLEWKDRPEDLEEYYKHYISSVINLESGTLTNNYVDTNNSGYGDTLYIKTLVDNADDSDKMVTGVYGENRFNVVKSYVEEHRTKIGQKKAPQQSSINTTQLFRTEADNAFDKFLPTGKSYVPKATDDYLVQLALTNDFLHDAYLKIYTYYAINKLSLPNTPYVPFAEGLKVVVTTSEVLSKNSDEVKLYFEHPFGISKETFQEEMTLVPDPEVGGELYLGIENAIEDQNIQLLFQIEEGSENPDAIDPNDLTKVTWFYLKNNTWEKLKPDYLLKDETDNFLKTGLVAFTVPKEFGNTTLFEEAYFWVKAKITKQFDTVSKFVNIHAQAIPATFINNNNTLEHLEEGLPAETISKLDSRLATVKKVQQPYASFNGKPEESDLNFYRRISERLRHKNRAQTVWDYEHLILQEFNFLHKIKCLNHSTITSFNAPGNVLLVALPDIKNQNVYDVYQPKLSQAKLNDIKTYINTLNTLHVDAEVISPTYEPVKIKVRAIFYKDLDANYYEKELQKDIAKYLAPWAFDNNQSITFGNALYESEVIYYIENLDYVDFINDFEMKHDNKPKKVIIPTDQKSILTSVQPTDHDVEAITTSLCPTT